EMTALYALADTYAFLGDYQKALESAQRILTIAQQLKEKEAEAFALVYLANTYFALGDLPQAIEQAQQSLQVAQQIKSPLAQVSALSALSIGYGSLEDYTQAEKLAKTGLAIAREEQASAMEGFFLTILGDIYRQSEQSEQAVAAYRQGLTVIADTEAVGADVAVQTGLARVYRDLNLPLTAITHYKQAVNGLEQIRRNLKGLPTELQESFLQAVQGLERSQKADIYRELADLLLSQDRILEAQQVLELLKVQELQEFTRSQGEQPEDIPLNPTEGTIQTKSNSLIAFGQEIYQCEQQRCNQLSQLRDRRDVLVREFDQQIQVIEQEFRQRRSQEPTTLNPGDFLPEAEAIVEAKPGTILIYPLVLEDKIWLLWASQGVVVNSIEVEGVNRRQLGETVLKFRQLLQKPDSSIQELQATGKQLYQWLIEPLESELSSNTADIQNLVFSLDRVTRYIPMAALFDGEQYLIERYTVSTVLSAGLTDMSERLPPGKENTPVLGLGLSKAVPGFNALANVPKELDAIVRQSSNDQQGIYPGLQLLNEAFDFRALRDNLQEHRILHVATHGEFVPGNPEDSYLLLGTGEKLAIPDIRTLQDLRDIHLVVLSACETALGGPDQDGVEIAGISSYFLRGKAKAVMASLWLVNDASTSQLMQHFYSNLAQGTTAEPMTKAEALRQAQLSMIQENIEATEDAEDRAIIAPVSSSGSGNSRAAGFSHPYYWAPFILIGNGF
ncbi:MAG: CHAT domain-containing protein, partial [Symploca sp. SIO2D2]|nr:CHAT domain-containing protein [Symploca sp. SIO2D2]